MRQLTFSLEALDDRGPAAKATRLGGPGMLGQASQHVDRLLCYSTHVPAALLNQQSDLIDQLMSFAHKLGAQRLEVYVRDDE